MSRTMYGFEYRTRDGWSAEACGEQNASNYLDTREEAEAQLADLAECMSTNGGDPVSVSDLRVVAVEVAS